MAEINFVRVDFRLIHGQVITKWIRQCGANEIVIVDDLLPTDEFLLSIYKMAAPPGFSVSVYTVDQMIKNWNENKFGNKKLFILFKDIKRAYQTITKGLPVEKLQIGGLGFAPGRVNVYGAISLDKGDASLLKELGDRGVDVYFQQVPDETPAKLAKVLDNSGLLD